MKRSVYCDLLSRVNVCIYILSVMLILQMLLLIKVLVEHLDLFSVQSSFGRLQAEQLRGS